MSLYINDASQGWWQQPISACNGFFFISNKTCDYCPYPHYIGQPPICGQYSITGISVTALSSSGYLVSPLTRSDTTGGVPRVNKTSKSVSNTVPQRAYVAQNGALRYYYNDTADVWPERPNIRFIAYDTFEDIHPSEFSIEGGIGW